MGVFVSQSESFLSFQDIFGDINSVKLPMVTMSVSQKKIKENLSLEHKITVSEVKIDLW